MTHQPTLRELVCSFPEGPFIVGMVAALNPSTHAHRLERFVLHVVTPAPEGLGLAVGTARRVVDALWPFLQRVGALDLAAIPKDLCRDHTEDCMTDLDEGTLYMYRLWINRFLAYHTSEEHANQLIQVAGRPGGKTQINVELLPKWPDALAMVRGSTHDLEALSIIVLANASLIQPCEYPTLDTDMFSYDEVTGITIIQMLPSNGYPEGRPVVLAWGDEIIAAYINQLRARGQKKLYLQRAKKGQPRIPQTAHAIDTWLRKNGYEVGIRKKGKDNQRRVNLTTCRQALASHLLAAGKGEQGVRQGLGLTSSTQFAVYKVAAVAHRGREKQRSTWGQRTDLVRSDYRRDCPVCCKPNPVTAKECQTTSCSYRFTSPDNDRVQLLRDRIMMDVAQFLEAASIGHRELAEETIKAAKAQAGAP